MNDDRGELRADGGGRAGERPDDQSEDAAAARAALRIAVGLAAAGDYQRARDICAAVLFRSKPSIAADRELLRIVLHAVLLARGFQLLSRLVMAIGGWDLELALLPDRGAAAEPLLRAAGRMKTSYAVHPGWLATLSPDDAFLRRWANALADGTPHAEAIVAGRAERELEPA